MKSVPIALMLPTLLAACAPIGFKHSVPLLAPDVVVYSAAAREHMASELEGGQCPYLAESMRDYFVIRNQSRAIAGKSVLK